MQQGQERKRLCFKTATELIEGYKNKTFTPLEVIRDILKRISEVNAIYNAMIKVQKQDILLKQAAESTQRYSDGNPQGLLDGIPITVKDLLFVPGFPTTEGSLVHPFPPDHYFVSPVVSAVLKQNAIIIGKTATSEYGWRGVGISPLSGVTRNPYDHNKMTGGSSAGSAVSVQLGFAPISIGTDAGGSVRIPAAYSGVAALKPSCGLIPHAPVSIFGSLAVVGAFARDVKDICLALDAMAYENNLDPLSIWPSRREESWTIISDMQNYKSQSLALNPSSKNIKEVKEMKIGVSLDLGGYVRFVDPQIKTAVMEVVEVFRKLGAQIEFIDQDPEFPTKKHDTYSIMKCLWSVSVSYLISYISQSQKEDMTNLRRTLEPKLISAADFGKKFTGEDLAEATHKCNQFSRDFNRLCDRYDLIITPGMAIQQFEAEKEVPDNIRDIATGVDSKAWEDVDYERFWCWTPFSYVFNMSKQPCAVVPCGKFEGEKGMPISVQIVGKMYADEKVLRACREYQSVTKWHERVSDEKL